MLAVVVAGVGFAAVAAALSSGLGLVDAARWAATQQRAYYEMMQELLQRRGAGASAGLIGACFVYGVVHAAVPGHGKFVIAATGVASRISALRLVGLALVASLAQAVTAIVLVYGAFAALSVSAGWAMDASRFVLEPMSALVIVAIGVVLLRRAARGRDLRHHEHDASCGHRHAPTVAEADAIGSWRDAAMLIASIGMRPCTGAVFVLAAAWRLGLVWPGAVGAVAMALGTGLVVSLVAVSAATARGATLFASGTRRAAAVMRLLQVAAGVAILGIGLLFLAAPFVGGGPTIG